MLPPTFQRCCTCPETPGPGGWGLAADFMKINFPWGWPSGLLCAVREQEPASSSPGGRGSRWGRGGGGRRTHGRRGGNQGGRRSTPEVPAGSVRGRAPGGRAGNAAPTRAGREEASVSASAGASRKVVAGRSGPRMSSGQNLRMTEDPGASQAQCRPGGSDAGEVHDRLTDSTSRGRASLQGPHRWAKGSEIDDARVWLFKDLEANSNENITPGSVQSRQSMCLPLLTDGTSPAPPTQVPVRRL